jgi:hypothetical protein
MSKPTWKLLMKDDGTISFWDGGQRFAEIYGYKYVDNFEWEDTLEYESFGRGTSAAHLYFKSTITGKSYQMFLKDFEDIVKLLVDGKVSGIWTFCKRGQNYGVKLLKFNK